jgi:hypothetical protein
MVIALVDCLKKGWMQRYRLFLFFIMSIGALCVSAQAVHTSVTGKVTDKKTGEPVEFAIVRFKGTTEGVATDSSGHFYISSPIQAIRIRYT